MPTPIIIDPLNLDNEQAGILHRYFEAEEKRVKGDRDKVKVYDHGFPLTLISKTFTMDEYTKALENARKSMVPFVWKFKDTIKGTDEYRVYGMNTQGKWELQIIDNAKEDVRELAALFPDSTEEVRQIRCFQDTPLMNLLAKYHKFPDKKQKEYLFTDNETKEEYSLCFTSPVVRRKERYKRIITLNTPPLPEKPEPNTLYVIYDQEGGADVYGVRDIQDIKGIEDEKPIHSKLSKKQVDKLKEQFSAVYLMKTPENNRYKASNPYQLYLYKEGEKIFFVDSNGYKNFVPNLQKKLKHTVFSQPWPNPQKLDNSKLRDYILKKTNEQYNGYAFQGITFDTTRKIIGLKQISRVMSECGDPINRYVYDVCGDKINRGGFSKIYRAKRRFEHTLNRMSVSEYVRTKIFKVTATKLDNRYAHLVAMATSEPKIWMKIDEEATQETTTHTQKATRQKRADGTFSDIYMLQDMFPGKTLSRVIEEDTLSAEQRYELTFKLLEALYLFHKAFVHRDIKPDNVMVLIDDQGAISVRIADVNISSREYALSSGSGTPGYTAPEICGKTAKYARKAQDVYSMGVLLRKLWKDKTVEKRKTTFGNQISDYTAAENFLQVSMKEPSSDEIDELGGTKRREIQNLLNEMTKTNTEERFNLDRFYRKREAKLANKPFVEAKEEKHVTVIPTEDDKPTPLSLFNRNAKLSLLSEALENYRSLLASKPATPTIKELFYRIDHLKSNSENLTPANLNKAIKLVADALRLVKQNPNDKQIKNQVTELKNCMKPSYRDFMRRAWNKTFCFEKDVEQLSDKKKSFKEGVIDFIGWPRNNGRVAKALSVLFSPFTILKNTIKLAIELPLTLISESFNFLSSNANGPVGFWFAKGLQSIPETIRFFARTVLSPVANIRECGINDANARRKDEPTIINTLKFIGKILLGGLSGVCSVAALGALCLLTAPAQPVALPWVFNNLGLALPTLPTLLPTIATPTLAVFLGNGCRESIVNPFLLAQSAQITPVKKSENTVESKAIPDQREQVQLEEEGGLELTSRRVAERMAEHSDQTPTEFLEGRLTSPAKVTKSVNDKVLPQSRSQTAKTDLDVHPPRLKKNQTL